jgi:RNA polymerase sigma-70 factor, ECF subfamily
MRRASCAWCTIRIGTKKSLCVADSLWLIDGCSFSRGSYMSLSVHQRGEKNRGRGEKLSGDKLPVFRNPNLGEPNLGGDAAPPMPRMNDVTDEKLLEAYRRGDRASFSKLVSRYHRELFHFLVRFLGDRAAAEDMFQETFLQVHQSADTFDPQRRFRPWLFTIAANKARDLIRAQSRRPTNPLQAAIHQGDEQSGEFIDLIQSAEPLPEEPLQRKELQQQVQRTVMEMPAHLREILLLSYFHQFPYRQIGTILGIPLGTVKSRLHAAVAYFADNWKRTNPGENGS